MKTVMTFRLGLQVKEVDRTLWTWRTETLLSVLVAQKTASCGFECSTAHWLQLNASETHLTRNKSQL